jgi:hypothetical protein
VKRVDSLLLAMDGLDRDGERQSGDGAKISDRIGSRDQGDRACVVSESGAGGQPRSHYAHIAEPGANHQD